MSVSKDAEESASAELADIVADARRNLEWLRGAGVVELAGVRLPSPSPRPSPAGAGEGVRGPAPISNPIPSTAPALASTAPALASQARDPSPPLGERVEASAYTLADKGCGSPGLLAIRRDLGECTRCKLSGGRTKLVFGVGNPAAELMFVGEGPGADEDAQGEPFVGKAGQLLTKMIEAMGFRRDEVYIANVVKCRPPGNRDPEPDEIAACEPFLKAQIAAVKPRVLVALGRFAVQTLLHDPTPISRQRGRWREYQGVRLMPTFHPAYLLRSPPEKKKAWEDLQLVMREFGRGPPR